LEDTDIDALLQLGCKNRPAKLEPKLAQGLEQADITTVKNLV
jgi:hypothetical protein